jgi:hypothetical protein
MLNVRMSSQRFPTDGCIYTRRRALAARMNRTSRGGQCHTRNCLCVLSVEEADATPGFAPVVSTTEIATTGPAHIVLKTTSDDDRRLSFRQSDVHRYSNPQRAFVEMCVGVPNVFPCQRHPWCRGL